MTTRPRQQYQTPAYLCFFGLLHMVDKSPASSTPDADESQPPAQPRRPGHRGVDMRDAVAEMAERAQLISQEAGSKVAAAMKDVISAAAGIAGFAIESARDLTQYMVRRGQMTPEEADKLIREAEAAHEKRSPGEKSRPTATKIAAEKAAAAKAEAAARAAAQAAAMPPFRPAARPVTPPVAPSHGKNGEKPAAGAKSAVAKPAAKAPAKAPAKTAAKAAKPTKPAAKPAKQAAKPAAKAPAKTSAKKAAKKGKR